MTTQPKNPPAGDPPGAGGQGGDPGSDDGTGADDPPPGDDDESTRQVSYSTHRKLLDEKKRVAAELAEIKRKDAERQAREAEEKGEFKKLLEAERARALELETKLKSAEEQETGRRKLASIINAVDGTIEPKWYGVLQEHGYLEEVIVDPDTGKVDPHSVARAVKKLRTEFPEIIKAKGKPTLPNDEPGGGGETSKIKRSAWMKLSSAEMKKYKPDQILED